MSRVGDKIKNFRMSTGMSQKQLAKKLGVAENFVKEVETGNKIINQDLIDRISKVLGKDINDIGMSFEDQVYEDDKVKKPAAASVRKDKPEPVSDVWNEAFASVIKSIPIYNYSLAKVLGSKQIPILNNKIEGHNQDKVFYIEIENDDMMGFRIAKGDLAFAVSTNEFFNNSISLIEYGDKRVVRQIQRLDNSKALVISNKGSVVTETVSIKDLKVIAKLERLEIKL
ncbi:MAG TPA: helix-turn-helix transcriptional regulator [Clostridiaceae bacterium]|nr:helix-turn-helix transcriptional regulator [Clostridiaceae bacterium]